MPAIRQAQRSDAAAIAAVHTESWRATYRDILPGAYLDYQIDSERTEYWTRAMATGGYDLVLVAEFGGSLTGFIALRYGRDPGYDATIEHLHVVPRRQGRGLGRRLLAEAARRLAAMGFGSVCLWVFEDNPAAIAFYERLGGRTDGHGVDSFAGADAPDRRIGWSDLGALIAAVEKEGT